MLRLPGHSQSGCLCSRNASPGLILAAGPCSPSECLGSSCSPLRLPASPGASGRPRSDVRGGCRQLQEGCWAHGTGWVKAPKIVQRRNMKNLMCQLNSLHEVGGLWLRHAAAHRLQYRAVIFLRPDVLYTDPLPVAAITNITVRSAPLPHPHVALLPAAVLLTPDTWGAPHLSFGHPKFGMDNCPQASLPTLEAPQVLLSMGSSCVSCTLHGCSFRFCTWAGNVL